FNCGWMQLFGLPRFQGAAESSRSGENCHLRIVDHFMFARRRGTESELAQLMVDAVQVSIERHRLVADAEGHGRDRAAFDHMRKVHRNMNAGPGFLLET